MAMTIEEIVRSLTYEEVSVLYWTLKNVPDPEIGKKFRYSPDWVRKKIGLIYDKLNYRKDLHSSVKRARLESEVKPVIFALVGDDPENLRDWPLDKDEESPVEQKIPPVNQEESAIKQETPPVEQKPEPVVQQKTQSTTSSQPSWLLTLLGCVIIGSVFLVCVGAVGFYFYRQWQNSVSPTSTQEINTPIPATSAVSPAQPEFTSIVPSETPQTPADTPIPTPEFYEQGQSALLKSGVTVSLQENFVDPNFGGCRSPKPGFVVKLQIRNRSGQEFLIRFDPRAFHAEDDLGNTYQLKGAGIFICDDVEIQNYQSKSETPLYLSFEGQIPLEAKYIVITADSLSGIKVVFHKLL